MRLDQYLVSNNFFTSRNKAQEAIKENVIYVNNKSVDVDEKVYEKKSSN